MKTVTNWRDLVEVVTRRLPETDRECLMPHEGDIGWLIRHVAAAHDLTFAEAAEIVTFRLPHYVEPERLSA